MVTLNNSLVIMLRACSSYYLFIVHFIAFLGLGFIYVYLL